MQGEQLSATNKSRRVHNFSSRHRTCEAKKGFANNLNTLIVPMCLDNKISFISCQKFFFDFFSINQHFLGHIFLRFIMLDTLNHKLRHLDSCTIYYISSKLSAQVQQFAFNAQQLCKARNGLHSSNIDYVCSFIPQLLLRSYYIMLFFTSLRF